MMKYACVRKCTFPLQLASVKHSIRCSDLNWFDVVDENMILGAIPLPKVLPDIMEESLKVKGVISCNEPHETKVTLSVEEWKERGVTNLKFNVADHIGAPTHAEVEQGLELINKVAEEGGRVYVHCKAGKGRSSSLVLCYLISKYGYTVDEALVFLRTKRKQIDLGPNQIGLARSWEQIHRGKIV